MSTKQAIESPGVPLAGEEYLQQGNAARSSLYVRAFRLVAKVLFLIFFRVRVIGKRNIPRTPVIICANHLGWTDAFMVLLFFPVEPRIYAMGEQEVKFISSFRRWVIESLQVFVMLDRKKPLQAIHVMEDILKRGGSILIFPEGRLGYREGDLQELQHGAAHISITSGVPLLPVGLTGNSELWLRRKLVVRIGEPVRPEEFEGDLRSRTHAITGRLDREMRALLPGDKQHARVKLLRRWLTKLL
jgi:1-acyl-sn-glycerol-3-phosphate acyltransferase